MPLAPQSILNDPSRLAALRALTLLDTPTEEAFDRLTRLASKMLKAPVSLVSLIDADRQFFKSAFGLPEPIASERQTPLSYSFCQHVVASGEPLIVEDARLNPLVADNLAIRDLNVIGYLGMPLTTSDGYGLGSFCVLDTEPRAWTPEEIEILRELAASVMVEIELRSELQARMEAEALLQAQARLLVETNEELATARRQAEAANQLKSQFLATMSHELRTPLNAIIGYTELQLAGMAGTLDDEQRGYQERVLVNADHLLKLINDLLDLAKIEAGRMDLIPAAFEVRAWLAEIKGQSGVLAEAKGLCFEVEIDKTLPQQLVADSARLKQVLLNLIANAVKFTEKGRVTVTAQRVSETTWSLVVEDTGAGIPSHLQETIFDEFRQLGEAHEHKGTGLGLAICRQLILKMGGTIRVRSTVGTGSVFTVILPLHTPEKVPALSS